MDDRPRAGRRHRHDQHVDAGGTYPRPRARARQLGSASGDTGRRIGCAGRQAVALCRHRDGTGGGGRRARPTALRLASERRHLGIARCHPTVRGRQFAPGLRLLCAGGKPNAGDAGGRILLSPLDAVVGLHVPLSGDAGLGTRDRRSAAADPLRPRDPRRAAEGRGWRVHRSTKCGRWRSLALQPRPSPSPLIVAVSTE